jgi:hypothetical protein
MSNRNSSAGTAADSSTQPIGHSSADIEANPVLGDVYQQVLQMFTSKDRNNWMKEPFLVGDKAASTNGWVLIAVPNSNYQYEDNSEKTKTVYPIDCNCEKNISLAQLKDAISKAPLIDCFDETEQKCSACYGEGEVEYKFSYGIKDYTIDHECPVCEGVVYKTSEIPNGKKEIDYTKFIIIGNSTFNIARVENIVEVAELLQAENITLVFQNRNTQASLFKVKDAEMIVMPCSTVDEQSVCANIA